MDYFFIFLFQVIGIAANVGQACMEIDKRTPDDTFGQVIKVFLSENRVSVFISAVILIFTLATNAALHEYTTIPDNDVSIFGWMVPYGMVALFGSLVLGYGGQGLFYFWLGKAKDVVAQKVMDRLSK